MNKTVLDKGRNSPSKAANSRHGQAIADSDRQYQNGVGQGQKVSERTEAHVLTVREVADWFKREGVIRSERSIARWCEPDAEGKQRLDAVLEDYMYWITRASAERVLAEEREKDERLIRYGKVPLETSGHSVSEPFSENEISSKQPAFSSSHSKQRINEDVNSLKAEIERLAQENRELKISNKIYDQMYFKQIDRMNNLAREVGRLEERVKQLPPGKSSMAGDGIPSGKPAESADTPEIQSNTNKEHVSSTTET